MDSLLEEEYFHVGTDVISKELWLNIQQDQIYTSYLRPYGGLWTSKCEFDVSRLCQWLDYLEESEDERDFFIEVLPYKKSCLVKFNPNTRFLKITSMNDFLNLSNSGFTRPVQGFNPTLWSYESFNESLDYEKISDFYDLIYFIRGVHPSLVSYPVNAMVALNSCAIEYYRPLEVDYLNQQMIKKGEPTKILEPSSEYYQLKDYISKYFPDVLWTDDYNSYIKNLYKTCKEYEKKLRSQYKNQYLSNGIPISNVINTIIRNLYHEKYRTRKLIKN